MNKKRLTETIRKKRSCLCIGLDTDVEKLPGHFRKDANAVLSFNKEIIDATKDVCVAYKINTAFYESLGVAGWRVLEETAAYIPEDHFRIADAKRGDIGNTSLQYARAFFESMPFDALTVAPYMGEDSIRPFMTYPEKWVIILGLTSNPGSADFQKLTVGDRYLWQEVLSKTSGYGTAENTMYVVGATQAGELKAVRELIPGHFLLVPGVGAQGGKISDVMENATNDEVGLLINTSRSVIHAGSGRDFADRAHHVAAGYQNEMKPYL